MNEQDYDDHRDTPGRDEAFDAAYRALMAYVPLAQIRAEVAERVTAGLLNRQAVHGLGHVHMLSGSTDASAERRAPMVLAILAGTNKSATSVTNRAVDAAVQAGAQALWDYNPPEARAAQNTEEKS